MSADVMNNNSINMDELSELSPIKSIETMKSRNIIMNAVLLGIQRAINRQGEQYNVPPSIRQNMLNEVQAGGGPLFSAVKTAKDVYDYKKSAANQLENIGIDKKTANELRSASSLNDVRNIGIKGLKRFGNVPPPPPERFGLNALKGLKQRIGLIKEEPETLTKEDLKRIGIEGLKRMGVTKRLGITDDQLRNIDSISPDTIKKIGKQVAIEKLKNTGILNKLGLAEDELKTLNISQIKQLGKQIAIDKLKNSGMLSKLGMNEEQIQNMTSNDIKRVGMERLKEFGQSRGITIEGINNVLSPDNPDFQKDTGQLVASKLFSNVKNMYVGLIKKIILVSDFFASKIIDFATQGALNIPIEELTSNTNRRLLVLAAYLREVANDPEQLKAIEEISEALGVMGIEFIDTIKPSVDKIVDKLINASKEVGSKTAFGAVQTFFSIASSMVAAVPGIGGIVDLIVSIAMGFNSFMRVVRTFVETNSEAAVDTAEVVGKTVGTARKNTSKIIDMVERLKESIPTSVPNQQENLRISSPNKRYEQQNGGRRYYMSKSRKRIENSVLRFKNLNERGKYSCHNHSSRTRKCIHY